MIKSFADKRTAAIFAGHTVRGLPLQLQQRARAKLLAIDAANRLNDLLIPPGNRLEALRADRRGQYSIRVNCLSYAEDPIKATRIFSFYSSKPSSRYPGSQPRELDSHLFAAMLLGSVPSRPRANSSVYRIGIAPPDQ